METILKFLINNKTILIIGVLVSILGGLYVYNRILALQVTIVTQELQAMQDQLAALDQANKLKDAYIADMAESNKSIEKFLNDQKQALERIDHDAPIDPDILGPDFFASLYGHK
jgi:septal ring factor EnvC (AmiA/AmiB activator)